MIPTISWKGLSRAGIALLFLVGAGQAMAAGTAANAKLENTVTATYKNLSGDAQTPVSSTAEITVLLLSSTPTLTLNSTVPADVTSLAEGQAIQILYDVTSTANGPDDYDLTTTETDGDNDLEDSTFTTTTDVGVLGATILVEDYTILATAGAGAGECTAAGTGSCTIKVPNDNAVDFEVNGFAGGGTDKIFFASIGATCTVTGVDDTNATIRTDVNEADGYSTITFDDCDTDGALTVADGAFETKTITFNLTVTTVSGANTVGDADLSTVAQDDGAVAVASASVDTTITVYAARIIIHKLVQNLDTTVVGTTTDPGNDGDGNQIIGILTVDDGTGSTTYYKSGVTAQPGDTLQYVVLVENLGAQVNDVVVSDALNVFTTYPADNNIRVMEEGDLGCTTGSTPASANNNLWDCVVTIDTTNVAAIQTPTDATDGDEASYNAGTTTISIYAGVGGSDAGTGGTIEFGKVSVGFYSVDVD